MINRKAYELGLKRSVIREIFEYGKKRAAEIGAENVYDFSLGNPSIPGPPIVKETLIRLVHEEDYVNLHGYTSAQGDLKCREKIAESLNLRFDLRVSAEDLYLTCGAAACLTITLRALCNEGDEVVVFAPYFPEYREFTAAAGAELVAVKPDSCFMPDFEAFERALNPKTKAVIVNSPNNPSGVVYDEDTIVRLAEILKKKSEQFKKTVYLISDEPYRELVYDKRTEVPFLTKYYKETVVCYSYSKSLSLPGERIGYILINPEAPDKKDLYAAVCGAGRLMGYVCAPSLFQRVVAHCDGKTGDLNAYKRNRDLLYKALSVYGFDCIYPDGAFYLFVKAPGGDAEKFCEAAKKKEILIVPGSGFGCPGYVRIAYCVDEEKIVRALPVFKELAKEYGLQK